MIEFGESREDAPSDEEVVMGYINGEIAGQAVMGRLLQKINLADKGDEPLIRRDGTPLLDENGNQVLAKDYMSVAKKHGAEGTILAFVMMDENNPDFTDSQEAITAIVGGYFRTDSNPQGFQQ